MNSAFIRKTCAIFLMTFMVGACGDGADEKATKRKAYSGAKGKVKQEAPATVSNPKDTRAQSTTVQEDVVAESIPTVGAPPAPVPVPSSTPVTPLPPSPVPAINLETAALNVMNAKCVSCHGAAPGSSGVNGLGDKAKLISAGYVVPKNAANSPLVRIIESGRMPPAGKLPQSEIDAVKNWINALAL
jgi:mono/diheme cytochrome c family protein